MNNHQGECPFHVGDIVTYKPSSKGLSEDVMSAPDEKLIPGERYRISDIRRKAYVVVEGYFHPGGGIYWSEFELIT